MREQIQSEVENARACHLNSIGNWHYTHIYCKSIEQIKFNGNVATFRVEYLKCWFCIHLYIFMYVCVHLIDVYLFEFTVENGVQFDAARAFLKELDVTEFVWIGLMRSQSTQLFSWT